MIRCTKTVPEELPFVSVIIPVLNEETHLVPCMGSVLAGDYPLDRLEILIVDGMSTDASRPMQQTYAAQYPFIRLLDNPRRIQAAALNLGIAAAKGDVIIRLDAHTLYASDYVRRCVELLRITDADNVGGIQRAVGVNFISRGIAIATASRFAVGDAYYRFSIRPRWVDTVYLGAWRKETLLRLGGFNESLEVNEDYELNYRLRKSGGKILLAPSLRCEYVARHSLRKLVRQYFRYGFWKVRVLYLHPESLRWRQLLPPLLVLSLPVWAVAFLFSPFLGLSGPVFYMVSYLLVSLAVASQKGWIQLPVLPLIFGMIHFSWGVGFLAGIARFGLPRIGPRALLSSFRNPAGIGPIQ
jgi:succinoglycan biosynthesis protein ExoA